MTPEQLTEKLFPYSNNPDENLEIDNERAAFLKGLELAEEFALWIDNKSPALQVAWAATFKLFLTEKYGNG